MIVDLLISSLFYIPRVPKIPSLYQNRSETPELSSPRAYSSDEAYSLPYDVTPCRSAILDVISYSEGTWHSSSNTNKVFDGPRYDIMYGGGTFYSYKDHPRQLITKWGYTSDASGAYQFLSTTWDRIADELNLLDFSPESQDQAAIHLIKKADALELVDKCTFNRQILNKLAKIWAGIPYVNDQSYYHPQPSKSFEELLNFWDSLNKN